MVDTIYKLTQHKLTFSILLHSSSLFILHYLFMGRQHVCFNRRSKKIRFKLSESEQGKKSNEIGKKSISIKKLFIS